MKKQQDNQIRITNIGTSQNVIRKGVPHNKLDDLYHFLMNASWAYLFAMILALYIGINLLFALAYSLGGNCIENAQPGSLLDAFFFSVQTMATIGYGKMAPITPYAHVLVTIEALLGLLGISMATGLMYNKFARPKTQVFFSNKAIFTRRDGRDVFMFRVGNVRTSHLIEAQIGLTLAINDKTIEGEPLRRLIDLPLERAKNPLFPLSWSVVHVIDEKSALYGKTLKTLEQGRAEIIVSFSGVEEVSSQIVYERHSYLTHELHWNARFVDVLLFGEDGKRYIDYGKFHDIVPVEIPTK